MITKEKLKELRIALSEARRSYRKAERIADAAWVAWGEADEAKSEIHKRLYRATVEYNKAFEEYVESGQDAESDDYAEMME
jgi:hypothetical protein